MNITKEEALILYRAMNANKEFMDRSTNADLDMSLEFYTLLAKLKEAIKA